MTVIAVPGDRSSGFTMIGNRALEDPRLSAAGRGVLAYLVGRPAGWETSAERLASVMSDGVTAIRSALRELERLGYLVRRRYQDRLGRWRLDHVVSDGQLTGGDGPALFAEDGSLNPDAVAARRRPGRRSWTDRARAAITGRRPTPPPRSSPTSPPVRPPSSLPVREALGLVGDLCEHETAPSRCGICRRRAQAARAEPTLPTDP